MKPGYILTLIAALTIEASSQGKNSAEDSLLTILDKELKNRHEYTQLRDSKIAFLKESLKESNDAENIYNIQYKLFQAYQPYVCDSAIYYLERNIELAQKLGNRNYFYDSNIRLAHLLSSSGMYKEAVDILDSIPKSGLNSLLTEQLFSTYDHVYGELAFYSRSSLLKEIYNRVASRYKDTLFKTVDPRSDSYLSMLETDYRDSGKPDSALMVNDIRLEKTAPGDGGYALVTFHRSLDYHTMGDSGQRKEYLIRSAIADTRAAIKDNASITLLANILFEEGDLNRAYNYIRYAMDDANFYNARLRNMQISEIQPIIDRTYNIQNENQKAQLRLFLIISVGLFIFSIVALWIIYLQKRKLQKAHRNVQQINEQLKQLNQDLVDVNNRLKHLNSSLAESNHVKEEYIGLFLSICSTYIDKMEEMRRMVSREITKGRVAELLTYSRSSSFIDNELKEFYNNFDNTFLHLYPNFVDEFNQLLHEDERISLKTGELLNTELRIFALIRLGITDSSKIAGLLRYSVNTIYNYRAKIKNKASVLRDDFENLVMEINSPDSRK